MNEEHRRALEGQKVHQKMVYRFWTAVIATITLGGLAFFATLLFFTPIQQ